MGIYLKKGLVNLITNSNTFQMEQSNLPWAFLHQALTDYKELGLNCSVISFAENTPCDTLLTGYSYF